jgi:uncharacterized OsmC-like protein
VRPQGAHPSSAGPRLRLRASDRKETKPRGAAHATPCSLLLVALDACTNDTHTHTLRTNAQITSAAEEAAMHKDGVDYCSVLLTA